MPRTGTRVRQHAGCGPGNLSFLPGRTCRNAVTLLLLLLCYYSVVPRCSSDIDDLMCRMLLSRKRILV